MDMSMSSTSMSMSMSTASASAAMSSMTGMSMSSGGDMPMMDGDMMTMSDMMMVFFTSTNTPLYSSMWMPSNTGQYAGTCLFLIVFAAIFRLILAFRGQFDYFFAKITHRTDTAILRSDYDKACDRTPLASSKKNSRPWKINEAFARAMLDTVLAGVGYLLMLAVMTMNVGYFLSVLAGTFLGSFIFGGWVSPTHAGMH